ncbi:hypothetical protein CXF59_01005 [Flavobacterium sp. ALD4]|uniref:hypothetical protein n=1 Tax=Flavobacterium sp. ALD4 TaxID=2058314 RepID=UPI000C333CFB|nr:hypothetical protein [Flavobacterium sp. ALD4]PKH68886.1 hypothetical protein CXF59_01005 [Flavobacterium sp. ALD4]
MINNGLEKRILERTNHLTKQNKQLEEFAYVVSHNFRAPVSNLHSLLYLCKEGENMQLKELLLERCEITVTNLDTIVNDLLSGVSIKNNSKKEKQNLVFNTCFLNAVESFQGTSLNLGL